MIKILTTLACAMGLSACVPFNDWVTASNFLNPGGLENGSQYSFDWHLSGERQIAPLQVFDNGKKTWLQFMPGQISPAIFRRTQSGEYPLSYTRRDDYLIIDGVWPELIFRGGSARAVARKMTEHDAVDAPGVNVSAASVSTSYAVETPAIPESDDTSKPALIEVAPAIDDRAAAADYSFSDDVRILTHASFDRVEPVQLLKLDDVMASPDSVPLSSYAITLQDKNMRLALHRWAMQDNWTFAPEHWAVDVDIPVSGEARFDGSFQDAVQDLLSATELAERPLRPCFYSNRVLRVVSYSQSCDRTRGGSQS